MIRKSAFTFALCLIALFGQGQNPILESKVHLNEKQNKAAARIPEILLKAYSNGDIVAYYPHQLKTKVPYAQFLNHFGMESEAYEEILNQNPFWFCEDRKYIAPDPEVVDCMQYYFEIGEQLVRNNITYQQDRKMVYVKVIYSGECTDDGLTMDGPVFKLGDIRKLKNSSEYLIPNFQNTAVRYTVADYLSLRLFKTED